MKTCLNAARDFPGRTHSGAARAPAGPGSTFAQAAVCWLTRTVGLLTHLKGPELMLEENLRPRTADPGQNP